MIQDYWITKIINNQIVSLIAILIPILQIYVLFLWYTSSCPKCNGGFAISEVDRELIDFKVLGKKRIENIKVTDGCRFCDYKKPMLKIKSIDIDKE